MDAVDPFCDSKGMQGIRTRPNIHTLSFFTFVIAWSWIFSLLYLKPIDNVLRVLLWNNTTLLILMKEKNKMNIVWRLLHMIIRWCVTRIMRKGVIMDLILADKDTSYQCKERLEDRFTWNSQTWQWRLFEILLRLSVHVRGGGTASLIVPVVLQKQTQLQS